MRRSRCPFYGAQHWQWYFRQIREILSSITSQVVDRSRLRLPPFFRGSTYLRSLSCPCHCFAFAFLPLGIKGGRRPIFHQKKLFIARPQETDSLRQLQVNLQNREEGYLISKVNRSRNQNRTRKQGVDPLLLTMVEGMPLFQCVLTTSQEQRQRLRGNTFRSRRGMRTTGEQFSDEGTDPLFSQSFGFTDQKSKELLIRGQTQRSRIRIRLTRLHLLALDTNPRECAIPFSLAHMHVLFLIRYGYPSASCFRFFYI